MDTKLKTGSSFGKQKEVGASEKLLNSFKTTTLLATSLIKERKIPKHELQKIEHGKQLLEEVRKINKEKATLVSKDKAKLPPNPEKPVVKALGNNLNANESEKGKKMISSQREQRRLKHLAALEECQKATEIKFQNFVERAVELKEAIKVLITGSDTECETLMSRLNDANLLKKEISFVNTIWAKIDRQKKMRLSQIELLRTKMDTIRDNQLKSDASYYQQLHVNLTTLAFILEPQVAELVDKLKKDERSKYQEQFEKNSKFIEEISEAQNSRFEQLFQEWQERVYRFHRIKHDDALAKFKQTMNSQQFVNPQTRVQLIKDLKAFQL